MREEKRFFVYIKNSEISKVFHFFGLEIIKDNIAKFGNLSL